MKKSTLQRSTKSTRKAHKASGRGQKDVRNTQPIPQESFILRRLKNNLRQMVAGISTGKKTRDYETAAQQLSAIAGLNHGHVWGWRYVASVLSGSTLPSKKFINAVNLYCEKLNPRKKQYFYFVRRHSFTVVYEKAHLREIVRAHQQERGYKMVTFKRYMEVKRRATQH